MRANAIISTAFAAGLTFAGAFSASAQNTQVLIKQIGDWHLYCDDGDELPKKNCTLKQHATAGMDDSQFVKVTVLPETKGTTDIAVYIPATPLAKSKNFLQVTADNKFYLLPKASCGQTECLFSARLFQPLTDMFFNTAKMGVNLRFDDTVLILSVKGLKEGINEMNALSTPPPGLRI